MPLLLPARKNLRLGEALVFDVLWMGIPVGTGELQVREKMNVAGRECFHVVAIAQTNEVLSALYPVHDEVHSFIDSHLWRSVEFRKKLSCSPTIIKFVYQKPPRKQ